MSKGGDWIREKRKGKGMRQEDVAARANVSVSYISTLERDQPHTETGVTIQPDRDKLVAIAKAVGEACPGELLTLYGYAAPVAEPQTVAELIDRLMDLGININLADNLIADNSPEALERAKDSITAILRAQFGNKL